MREGGTVVKLIFCLGGQLPNKVLAHGNSKPVLSEFLFFCFLFFFEKKTDSFVIEKYPEFFML